MFYSEEKKWLDRLSNCRVLTGQIQKLDKEMANQKREIGALQRAVTDMQSALVQERKISAKVYAENDKLKVSSTIKIMIPDKNVIFSSILSHVRKPGKHLFRKTKLLQRK